MTFLIRERRFGGNSFVKKDIGLTERSALRRTSVFHPDFLLF